MDPPIITWCTRWEQMCINSSMPVSVQQENIQTEHILAQIIEMIITIEYVNE